MKLTWHSFPSRQLTGKSRVFHGYVGREKPERTCGHEHLSADAAQNCSDLLARRLSAHDLLASNARLRKALERIVLRVNIGPNGEVFDPEKALDHIGRIARAVLAATP